MTPTQNPPRRRSLRRKIVLIGVSQIIVVGAILAYVNRSTSKTNLREEYVARARSIALTAEAVREEMARKWELGLFDAHQLSQWHQQGQLNKVLGSVPVVTAWNAAMAKAKEGGYEFRVPKIQPRKPENQPDKFELQALEAFQKDASLSEYYAVDTQTNALRYLRPIRLTRECLLCHGNPAESKALWGNDQGLDPSGVKMENWQVGEVHGAFEVVQSLDEADARAAAAFWRNTWIVLVLIGASGGALFLLVSRLITRPIRETVAAFRQFADGDLTHQMPIQSHDEIGQL